MVLESLHIIDQRAGAGPEDLLEELQGVAQPLGGDAQAMVTGQRHVGPPTYSSKARTAARRSKRTTGSASRTCRGSGSPSAMNGSTAAAPGFSRNSPKRLGEALEGLGVEVADHRAARLVASRAPGDKERIEIVPVCSSGSPCR